MAEGKEDYRERGKGGREGGKEGEMERRIDGE